MPTLPTTYSPTRAARAQGLIRSTPRQDHDDRRGSAHERGYGARWQKVRVGYLASHPLCCCCKANGRVTAATVVDHIEPHRGDMARFWNRANWQPLCDDCHNRVKAALERLWDAGKAPLAELRLDRLLPAFFSPPPGG